MQKLTTRNTDDWYNGTDLGNLLVLCTYVGLKKAFDTVDHNIICKKLELYGVQQRDLSWFKSYLSNRKQFCRVNGVDSKLGDILGESEKTWGVWRLAWGVGRLRIAFCHPIVVN